MSKDKTAEQKAIELENEKSEEAIKVVGQHNNTFDKDYEFKEIGVKFNLRLKFPTLIDQARVSSEAEREFHGMSSIMNNNFTKAVYMIKMISYQQDKYAGDKEAIYIPEFLRKPEEVYNVLVLAKIADDFQEWMDTFRY